MPVHSLGRGGGGSCDRSHVSHSRSTTRLRSRGRRRFRWDSSCVVTGTSFIELARSLGVTVRGLDECDRVRLAVARLGITIRDHTGPADRSRYRERSWWSHGDRMEAVVASRDRCDSGSGWSLPLQLRAVPSPGSRPVCRILPGCSSACRGPLRSGMQMCGLCFLAAGVTGDWVLPGPAAPVSSAAPFTCLSASVPAPGVLSPASAASVTSSAGRHERAWESARSVRHHRRSSGGERSCSGKRRGEGRSPSPARSSRSARASVSSSFASSDTSHEASTMPPPPAGCPGVGGSCSKGNCSAFTRDRFPQPGLSGLGSGSRSFSGAAQSRSEYGGQSSLVSLATADDDCS